MKNVSKPFQRLIIAQFLLLFTACCFAKVDFVTSEEYGFWPHVIDDYKVHYGFYGLPRLLAGLSIAGILANTDGDHSLRDEWQKHLRNKSSDNFFSWIDDYGSVSQYQYVIPIYLISSWAGYHSDNKTICWIGKWGAQSFRALLLGAPQQAILTEMLGSPRPPQGPSKWSWFKHNRAVSGHAFYGSLPILSAAKLTDSIPAKVALYTLSLLPPIARIHNDKHYTSQAFLGWWIALQSTNSVAQSNNVRKLNDFQAVILPNQIYFHYTRHL